MPLSVTSEPLPAGFTAGDIPVFRKGDKVRHKADPAGPVREILSIVDGKHGCRWEQQEPGVDKDGQPVTVTKVYHDNFDAEQLVKAD